MNNSYNNFFRNTLLRSFGMLLAFALFANTATAQKINRGCEAHGNVLNLGIGVAYFGFLGGSSLLVNANYEFDVARNFTLAPFIGFTSYRSNNYYQRGTDIPYYYRYTVVPMGVKGTYYFDQLLGAGPRWDFYVAGSLGFNYNRVTWSDGYYGDKSVVRSASPLYLDLHVGAEYRVSRKVGLFFDLSTGVSTFGLAIHGTH